MVTFDWLRVPLCMKVGLRCASTIPGGPCVTIHGTILMQLWFANNWDMHILEVSVMSISVAISCHSCRFNFTMERNERLCLLNKHDTLQPTLFYSNSYIPHGCLQIFHAPHIFSRWASTDGCLLWPGNWTDSTG